MLLPSKIIVHSTDGLSSDFPFDDWTLISEDRGLVIITPVYCSYVSSRTTNETFLVFLSTLILDTNIDELALTCRAVGQSVVGLSVKQVSLARLLDRLLKMTRKHDMVTKPELLLLQKAMMLVEGVGVDLDENLNMWELARPWIKDWAIKNVGFDAKIRDEVLDLLDLLKKLPDIIEKIKTKLA